MTNFSSLDSDYFKRRAVFTQEFKDLDLWRVADNWPLFAGAVNISRFLAIYELFKSVAHLPGHMCELGCWHGANLLFLGKLVKLFKPFNFVSIYGFDSFEGLQTVDSAKDKNVVKGSYTGDLHLLEQALALHDLQDVITLVKGDILETLPSFLEKQKEIRFSFIYFDLDLFAPTKSALELLYPRLLSGGILAFDEYNIDAWPGETSAIHEVLGEHLLLKTIPFARQPTAYLIKS